MLETDLGLTDAVLCSRLLTVLRLTETLCVHPLTSVLKCGTSYGIEVHRWVRVTLRRVRKESILDLGTPLAALNLESVVLNVVVLVVLVEVLELEIRVALLAVGALSPLVEAKLTGPVEVLADAENGPIELAEALVALVLVVEVLLPSTPVHLAVPRVTSLLVGPPSNVTFRLKSLRILRSRPLVVRFNRTVKDAPFSSPTSRVGLPTLLGTGTGIGLVNTLVTLLLLNVLLRCLETIEVKVLPTDLVIGVVNPVYRLTAFLI